MFPLYQALIYLRSVIPSIAFLAKAANDQIQMCVPEDNIERITFIQKVCEAYDREHERVGKQSEVAAYLMKVVGAKKENAKGYHAQLVGIARAMSPMVTKWLVDKMEEYEIDDKPVLSELVSDILYYLRVCHFRGHTHNEVDEISVSLGEMLTIRLDDTAPFKYALPQFATQQ
jgi:hypothetical protein